MEDYVWHEKEIDDSVAILDFVKAIIKQEKEMVLMAKGEIVGAILTKSQYNWFLDKIDEQQDLSFIEERVGDLEGSQNFDELKRELGK